MENRAAVFTREPQEVEVYHDGVWWPGSLLGWRHDAHGSCQVWVRFSLGGTESTAWTDLDTLRLPGAASAAGAGQGAPRPGALSDDTMVANAVVDPAATRQMQRVGGATDGSRRSGRPAVPVSAPSREKRSDEAGWRRAAAEVGGGRGAAPGRHRAPAAASGGGRHRAADTGAFPAVADVGPVSEPAVPDRASWPMAMKDKWPVVVEDAWAPSADGPWATPAGADVDLFTRPLRLKPVASGALPQPRATWDARPDRV